MSKQDGADPAVVGYPIYDAHGNRVATLTKDGTSFSLTDVRSYDAWGNVRVGAQTGRPRARYCANLGHVQDDESGLVYMRARYYEPTSGRFVSEDAARDGGNWLVFCRSNPINLADQSGQLPLVLEALGMLMADYLRIMAMITSAAALPKAAALRLLGEASIEIETEFLSTVTTSQIQLEIAAGGAFAQGDIQGAEFLSDLSTGVGIAGKALYWSLRSQCQAEVVMVLLGNAGQG